jgi:hypothetical protein
MSLFPCWVAVTDWDADLTGILNWFKANIPAWGRNQDLLPKRLSVITYEDFVENKPSPDSNASTHLAAESSDGLAETDPPSLSSKIYDCTPLENSHEKASGDNSSPNPVDPTPPAPCDTHAFVQIPTPCYQSHADAC